jgi:hypothetical protein
VYNAAAAGNAAPSKQVKEAYAELATLIDGQLGKLQKIITGDLVKLNQLIHEKTVPVIGVKKEKE